MARRIDEREVLERLEKIEEALSRLNERIDDLTRNMGNIFGTSGVSGVLGPQPSRDYKGLPLRPFGDFDTEAHKKSPSPWTMKSLAPSRTVKRIDVDLEILGDPETLLPTLRALKSSKDGLTADEVSKITRRNRSTEANYLSKMFKLGALDKVRLGKSTKYKLSEKWIPPHIREQI